MNPRRWPLALQLALAFALVAALALGGGGALLLRQVEQRAVQERADSLEVLAVAAAAVAEEHLTREGGAAELPLALWRFWSQFGVRPVVVNAEGVVISDAADPSPLLGQRLNQPELGQALAGEQAWGVRRLPDTGPVMYVAVPVKSVGAVLLSADLTGVDATLADLRRQLWLAAAGAGLAAVVLGVILAGGLTRPLSRLTLAADRLAGGELSVRVPEGGSREVARLSRSFNHMGGELGALDRQRRAFVADASHELRTPLAAIGALTEALLRDTKGDLNLYKEFLGDINREIQRASRLVDRLLDLARLDQRREAGAAPEAAVTDLAEVARAVTLALAPLGEARQVALRLVAVPGAAAADPQLVETILVNLIENGLKYTPAGGSVTVTAGPGPQLAVADTGIGIPKEHLPHIFERFYRVDKARSRATGGTGLGLSLVAEAAAAAGAALQVQSHPGVGTSFFVQFPAPK